MRRKAIGSAASSPGRFAQPYEIAWRRDLRAVEERKKTNRLPFGSLSLTCWPPSGRV